MMVVVVVTVVHSAHPRAVVGSILARTTAPESLGVYWFAGTPAPASCARQDQENVTSIVAF
ncbi:hypothetical protein PAXINDRAFT_11016 [Paxillus involutus ATCC 200175]|nr:hypothetical protein PAXINDRAFT_11016 [Paxillus involutus ATCC 200175]